MNNIIILSFTQKGADLSVKIIRALEAEKYDCLGYTLPKYACDNLLLPRELSLNAFVEKAFVKGVTLVFVGATGIAVRAISPFVKDKTCDPAVIVIDELGNYVIPLLSGHIGGANKTANLIGRLLNAKAVITTATDVNNAFSVDTWAVNNNYSIHNPEVIKNVSSAVLNGEKIMLFSDFDDMDTPPDNIILKDHGEIGVCISLDPHKKPYTHTLNLTPKCHHVGIGLRRGIPFKELEAFFLESLTLHNIPLESIGTLSSIDLKQDELALLELVKKYNFKFTVYTAKELSEIKCFDQSPFVKSITGVGNVCGTSAYISSKKGCMVMGKTCKNGMTMAIARESWRVCFENINDWA